MVSASIKVSFEFPEDEAVQTGLRPFIYLDTLDLVDAAIEGGVPDHSPVIGLIHQAGECFDVQSLLEGYVMSHVAESRSAAAYEIAEWLEALAKMFRKGGEDLELSLKPRSSPSPRF
ncbi:hypothetical protein SAMN05216509_4092 [Pseudomonas sp. B10]|uniref:hypothetical protein n=1 Tax=Pseudomonas sp. B10 TaxID=118613 RepID=UPI0009538753|nr:hypothetical protein [Pseudomonas sp. B10]SIR70401.1 hypothetical protein SAMN05216509_4092 [Pseudomonas sp. B10]